MEHDPARAARALQAYNLHDPRLIPLIMGNINETYEIQARRDRYIFQRLNPIFKPEIHHDIDIVTTFLANAGLVTPRLIRTRDANLWTTDLAGGVWRLQTFIDGVVHSHAQDPSLCGEAGRLLGHFHRVLSQLQHTFRAPRLGVHDTPRHLQGLRDALAQHVDHQAHGQVAALAQPLFAAAAALPDMSALPARVVHGDPKLNNVVFSPTGTAIALIDLDTLASMPITLELGDALRSWCNPHGENQSQSAFSMPHFQAALQGYATGAGGFLTALELALLPWALETIALELAARFARDALEERYFGWDHAHYTAAWEHNLVRAKSQLTLALSYAKQRDEATGYIQTLFSK